MTYQDALASYRIAEAVLSSWDKKLRDPKKFYPVIKAEWDRAFDRRENARDAAQRADPLQFWIDHPHFMWANTVVEG